MQERFSRKTEAADLRRAFTLLDAKGDGKIDAAELGLLFKKLGHKERTVKDILQQCCGSICVLWYKYLKA